MAQSPNSSGQKPLQQHPIVESLVPDPSVPSLATVAVGFVGKSVRVGYWRLYMSPGLREYVEFRENDVLHSQPLEASQSPLGGTAVWFKADAELTYTSSEPWTAQAEFLQGRVSDQWLPNAGSGLSGMQVAGVAAKPGSPGFGCAVSNLFGCRTHRRTCRTYHHSGTSCCLCPAAPA
jgi:hypothetical protein